MKIVIEIDDRQYRSCFWPYEIDHYAVEDDVQKALGGLVIGLRLSHLTGGTADVRNGDGDKTGTITLTGE